MEQNVQKSVTHAQSCCPKLIAFYRSRLTKTAKQSVFFFSKSVKKSVSLSVSASFQTFCLIACALEYAKIRTVLQSRLT